MMQTAKKADGQFQADDDDYDGSGRRGMKNGNFAMQCLDFCMAREVALECLLAAWVGIFEGILADEGFVPVICGGISA